MAKPTLSSWFAELLDADTASAKPDTRARLAVQPLDNRDLPTVLGGSAVVGSVYVDANCNGTRDAHEAGIEHVRVTLTGKAANGQAVHREVRTDHNGNFAFGGLPAGCYTLTETQPAGFRDGRDTGPTSPTANDTFGNIRLTGSPNAVGRYNFGELPAKTDDGKGSSGKGSKGKGSSKKGSKCKASGGKGSSGKGSNGRGSACKGSSKKGSSKKGSKGKGSSGKGSSGKGSGGKCDIWVGFDPKKDKDGKYESCGYGYRPCDDKGSSGKGSACKGSSGKGSSGKGSKGKGSSGKGDSWCGIDSGNPKAKAASALSALYGVGGGKAKK